MHGRCLTRGVGNVADLDLFIKNNEHYYDIFVYGYQQEKNISTDIMLTVKSTIQMKLLFYLNAQIHNSIRIDVFNLKLNKNISAEIPMEIGSNMAFLLEKNLKASIALSLKTNIDLLLDKVIKASETKMSIITGTLNQGKTIADIENFLLEDLENTTLEELCKGTKDIYGLRLGLVKPMKISDIEHLIVSQVADLTIDELCFTRME